MGRTRAPLIVAASGFVVLAVLVTVVDVAPEIVTVVMIGGSVAVLGATAVLHHRSQSAVLRTNRRRLRATVHTLSELSAAVRVGARSEELRSVRQRVEAAERQARAESAELSRQLAALRRDMVSGQEHIAGLLAAVHVNEAVDQLPPAPRRTDALRSLAPDVFEVMTHDAVAPSVVLVLDTFTPAHLFAGVRTTLLFATALAARLERPLHVVVMRDPALTHDEVHAEVLQWVAYEANDPGTASTLKLTMPGQTTLSGFHPEDIWVATYWSTATAIGLGVAAGRIRRHRVVYLIQDWEPAFFPWGDQHAAARATYDLGFTHVVNSAPLADYVAEQTGRPVPEERVLHPQVDDHRLMMSAATWMPRVEPSRPRVLFYARPGKPRNLFALGALALRRWASLQPEGVRPVLRVAGEDGALLDLGPGVDVEHLGKISLAEYYHLLADTDVALALMHSPHPSHLPLELAMAGVPVITNSFGQSRQPWLPGVIVAEPVERCLAQALITAQLSADETRVHVFEPMPTTLGVPLKACVAHLADSLRKGAT